MKHKIILEIKKVAADIEQSNSFSTKHYIGLLEELRDKFVILDYLEENIKDLVAKEEEKLDFANVFDEKIEEKAEKIEIKDTVIDELVVEEVLVTEEEVEVEKEEILAEDVEEDVVEKIEEVEQKAKEINLEDLRNLEQKVEAVGNREVKKSLHEELKKNVVNIGLNDRIAFVKILFDGNQQDFNRVLSQVNSFHTKEELRDFINNYVKPDHNWDDKEEYSERFMEIIESKFD